MIIWRSECSPDARRVPSGRGGVYKRGGARRLIEPLRQACEVRSAQWMLDRLFTSGEQDALRNRIMPCGLTAGARPAPAVPCPGERGSEPCFPQS